MATHFEWGTRRQMHREGGVWALPNFLEFLFYFIPEEATF